MSLDKYLKGPAKLSFEQEKVYARNPHKHELRQNERKWFPGAVLEVTPAEAKDLHEQGFEILDDQNIHDIEEEKKEQDELAQKQKEGPHSFDPKDGLITKKEGE